MVQCVKDAALSLQQDLLACDLPHVVGEAKKKKKAKHSECNLEK